MRRIGCLLSLSALGMTPLMLGCGPEPVETVGTAMSALGQSLERELEPNNGPVQATSIGSDTAVRANIFATGDNDFFKFTANAGDRVFAATMTAFSPVANTSQLALFDVDGLTQLEVDSNNGVFAPGASSIAGTTLPNTGTYYLRVTHLSNSSQIRPYDLHFRLQNGMPVAETEPNDLSPQMLPVGGYVSGSMASQADVDSYSLMLNAGDTVFASLDLDPERDGTEYNGQLTFTSPSGTLVVNDGDISGTPDSEALFATVQSTGTYELKVGSTSGSGAYRLSVSVHPATDATPNCTTYTSVDVPKAIGPADTQAASSTITIPGNPRIADMDVSIQLNHQSAQDLDVHLVSPAGNTNALFTDIGGANPVTMDLTLNDEGAFPVGSTGAPFSGLIMQPKNNFRLHWFDGEDAGGTWTLVINDDANNNAGNLTGWSIRICEPPAEVVTCAAGMPITSFSTDFEMDGGGFVGSGTQNEWARGNPTSVPVTGCNSGTNCWKTDLTGTYNNNSNQNLTSAPINLSDIKAPIALSWAMKYQMETATNDRAYVEIREVGGANPTRLWQFLDDTMVTQIQVGGTSTNLAESAGWGVHTADISAYAGKNVEIVFHVDSNGSTNYAGLAIDDVSIIGCPAAICGNAMVEGNEQCDDGNMTDGDGCDNNCTMTACGNGVITLNEMCDDGNQIDGDDCDSNCTLTGCGNSIVTGSEDCDDGNMINGDMCDNNCTITGCGNGITTDPEMCDDANGTDGDGCDSNCTTTMCGNAIPTDGEACDDGNMVEGDGCDSNCTISACGNMVTGGAETCDDGNQVDGDGCDSNCTITGCGNDIQTMDEQCDDNNVVDGDGCDSNCTFTGCGNGVPTDGEACDDGNLDALDGCDGMCAVEMGYECTGSPSVCNKLCGNGEITGDEQCDDGNANADDGCSDTCMIENGYACNGTPSTCAGICGDSIVVSGEECDDGNTTDGDGCSSTCTKEGAGGSGGGGVGGGGSGGNGETGGAGGSGGSTTPTPGVEGGCNCSVPGNENPTNKSVWAGLLLALAFLRRRR